MSALDSGGMVILGPMACSLSLGNLTPSWRYREGWFASRLGYLEADDLVLLGSGLAALARYCRLVHLNRDTAVILVEYAYVLVEIDTTLNPPRAYSLSVNERFAGCGSVMDNEVSISQPQL